MEPMEKLWQKVDKLSETQVRQDERMSSVERQNQQLIKHMSTLEGKLQSSIEGLGAKFDECFAELTQRMSEYDAHQKEQEGYERARKEMQATMFKRLSLWVSVGAIGASLLTWWFSR